MFGVPRTLDEIIEFQQKAYAQRDLDLRRPPEPGEPVAELNLRTLSAHLDLAGLATPLVWDGDSTVRLRPGHLGTSEPAVQGARALARVADDLTVELAGQLHARLRGRLDG